MFTAVNDRDLLLAKQAMDNSRLGKKSRNGFADLMAAGSAMAIEQGAPYLLEQTSPVSMNFILSTDEMIGRKLQLALGRCLHDDPEGLCENGLPSKSISRVVADVSQQISATKIVAANRNPEFFSTLNEPQKIIALEVSKNERLAFEMEAIMKGEFHRLSPDMAGFVEKAINSPQNDNLSKASSLIGKAVDISAKDRSASKRMHSSEFKQIPEDAFDKLDSFYKNGSSTGNLKADSALTIFSEISKNRDFDISDPMVRQAQARLISRAGRYGNTSAAYMAGSIVSEIHQSKAAESQLLASVHPVKGLMDVAKGNFHKLDTQKQDLLSKSIDSLDSVSSIDIINISKISLGLGVGNEAPLRHIGIQSSQEF